jgi:hypothetical protein
LSLERDSFTLLGAIVPVTWTPPWGSVLSWNTATASPLVTVKVVPSLQVKTAPATGTFTTCPGLAEADWAVRLRIPRRPRSPAASATRSLLGMARRNAVDICCSFAQRHSDVPARLA